MVMIMKKKCALYASKLVKDGMVVGLGGGSTIQYLIDYVKDKDIQVVTPSAKTALKAQKEGLTVLNTQYVDHVDIAFDGCDEVDSHLNALKSGGGIHTQEKIIASMADEYIVLVDETKFHETLAFQVPVVVEVLPKAYSIVKKKLGELNGIGCVLQKCRRYSFVESNLVDDAWYCRYKFICGYIDRYDSSE